MTETRRNNTYLRLHHPPPDKYQFALLRLINYLRHRSCHRPCSLVPSQKRSQNQMVSLGSVNGSLQPVHFLPMSLVALVRIATTPGGALGIARRSSDTIDVLPNSSASLIPPDGFRAAVKGPAVVE